MGTYGAMTANPIQVQKYLKDIDYPTSKDKLVERAKKEGADAEVVRTLESLPKKEFDSPAAISKEIGKSH